jgi:single-strand DNA-binding protein
MTVPETTERPAGEPSSPANKGREPEDMGEGHISGNLTEDPSLRFTPTGRAVANLRLAYTPRVKDDDTGRWSDGETEFYSVTVWGTQGEHCAEHLQRGDRVVAVGRWSKRFWEDREGEQRESVELTAQDIGPSLLFRGAIVKRTDRNRGARSDG